MVPRWELVRQSESSCTCREVNWDFECCPLSQRNFRSLQDMMPGPSTGKSLDEMRRLTRECFVALRRLEDLPGVRFQNHAPPETKSDADGSTSSRGLHRPNHGAQLNGDDVQVVGGTDEDSLRDRVRSTIRRSRHDPQRVLTRKLGYSVTVSDLRTLLGTNWLNDVVIDFYMGLIAERASLDQGGMRVHAVTTHFINVLRNRGYDAVRRWTEGVDLFDIDLMLVPVHDQDHWSLVALWMQQRMFSLYDSMGRENKPCYRTLMDYLRNEHRDKKRRPLVEPDGGWVCQFAKNIPMQSNTHDCGVFVCLYAERLVRNAPFDFSARDIQRLRYRMAYEILTGKLL
ncbi:hypothetical protein HPB47_024207 [Ixodes persulcatus]|uniref:Uncharacterized protein n=1 Tax=Ixodes persulcatus TaxID=34615 RepID=A0AC60Q6W2_IXOPE|nr:hypothetical protein HPB47_024207 [Ixodes persulcatus]